MAEQQITYVYWRTQRMGEGIRWLFKYLGQEYTEVQPSPAEWPQQKQDLVAQGEAIVNLPYIIDGDFKLTETGAIPYYVAHKYGRADLFGNGLQEQAKLLELRGVFTEIRGAVLVSAFTPLWKAAFPAAFAPGGKVHTKLGYLDKFIGEQEWFVGGHVSYFDLEFAYFLVFLDWLTTDGKVESGLGQHKNLLALKERVLNLPGIKEHVASPDGQYPFLPPQFLPWQREAAQ